MSLIERKDFYVREMVDGNAELDYLTSSLNDMQLSTVESYRISNATAYRPDLISSIYYQNYNLGWLIAYHNNILDPITEFYMGRVIDIPSLTEYYQFYNRNSRS